MAVLLNPYLSFVGTAGSAMEFYRSVFGGELRTMRFGDMPEMPGNDPALHDQVMHSHLVGDHGIQLMGADLPPAMGDPVNGTVSLSGTDIALLRGWWDQLSDGGTVSMPLSQAPWGDYFGQFVDRFGISWMVNIGVPASS